MGKVEMVESDETFNVGKLTTPAGLTVDFIPSQQPTSNVSRRYG